MDGEAAMDYLLQRSDINKKRIVVFGRSLGGGVAVRICAMPQYSSQICAMVLENTFTSLPDIARHVFSISAIAYLPVCCFKSKVMTRFLFFCNILTTCWYEPSPLFAHRVRPTPLKCKNEYPVLPLGEETAVQAVVGSKRKDVGR